MKIENVINYQQDIISFLKNAHKKNRLNHAYIFEGEQGTGTYEAALYFAMMLLCKNDEPCLKCNICERIMFNSHMNVITIDPFNNMIKKDQIEGLMHDFHHTNLEGGANVYIIKDANLMNTSAANALLKILEEPNPSHYVILTCKNHLSLLSTIISRCQVLKFKALPNSIVEEELIKNGNDANISYIISRFTSDLDEANALANGTDIKEIYNIVKKIYISKFKKNTAFNEYFISREFILNKDITYQDYFLGVMILILEEYIKNKNGNKYFGDIYAYIAKSNVSDAEIIRMLNILLEYQMNLRIPTNLDLFYTALFQEI